MSSAPLIQLNKASKTYGFGNVSIEALKPTDLKIGQGEFICIAGPSGSGKTTLLNLIGCIDVPTSGAVKIAGAETSGLSRSQAAELRLGNIGFVFQRHNLVPVFTAYENVEYVLLLKNISASQRKQMVEAVLERVGLADQRHKKPSQMSGGQQQRAAVARAIVAKPSIIAADEPTANLDSKTACEIVELLKELNQTEAITCVFSSHDQKVIERAARVVKLADGIVW